MEFIETSAFTRQVLNLLGEDEYRDLQLALFDRPDLGVVIPASGGLRKLRWRGSGRGKRGGVRMIYFWQVSSDRILLLLLYAKNEQDDLTPQQARALRRAVEEELR